MPRQNRVTPDGLIVAVAERGMFMGNRGILHDTAGQIVRPYNGKRWIICRLEFKGRKRALMQVGHYTELFFLDEATALAAGHRPCAECRRDRFLAFRQAWAAGNLPGSPSLPTATVIDTRLHTDRVNADRSHRCYTADLDDLPDGCIVQLEGQLWLVRGDWLLAWSAGGYCEQRARPWGLPISVLTPRSTVETLRAGYVPILHASADTT
jgi:hypothetical protein